MAQALEPPAPTVDPSTRPTDPTPVSVPRVLVNMHHGQHVAAADLASVDPTCAPDDPMEWAKVRKNSTPFGYMFDDLRGRYPAAHLPAEPSAAVVASLKALGTAMVDQPGDPTAADSAVPPIYTYWGQFVDHDLTANTDRDDDISITDVPFDPIQPERVARDLRNLRQPRLNLDSVYGNGPAFSGQEDQVPYDDGQRLHLDPPTPGPGNQAHLAVDDLPRAAGKVPLIGDRRNDENLVVAQLHIGFLKFHNAVLDWFATHPGPVTGDGGFERARQLTEWHYQWVTVHDFLMRIADQPTVTGLLDHSITPRFTIDTSTPPDKVFMPLEFSIAAYRFGHSMVRAAYDWNENFGFPKSTGLVSAPFELLFRFTGNGGLGGPPGSSEPVNLPDNWPARFERLTGFEPRPAEAVKEVPPRFARKIDTRLAPPLADLSNEANAETSDRIRRILKRLAVRNLLRGYRLSIPTGQAVARSLGITPLSRDELIGAPGTVPSAVEDAIVDGGFVDDTPLWFYVLKEAEALGDGERLGPVGSRIVAETIIGQLRADPTSFLNQNWTPAQGVTTDADEPVDTIITFLRFAGRHP